VVAPAAVAREAGPVVQVRQAKGLMVEVQQMQMLLAVVGAVQALVVLAREQPVVRAVQARRPL